MASKMRDILAAILILAILMLAFIGIFRAGPTGEWTSKFRELETKDSNVALTFTVLLAVVVLLHPGLRKALKKSFMEAFWHRWTLIVLLVYLLVATYLLWPLGYRQLSDRTPLYYLLSAQAQVLSAIVALVFTTTIVVAQLVSRYSQRILHQVLGSWVLWYLVLYLIGIIHPLLLLNRDFSLRAAQISLLIGGFCLVLLIPYYRTLRDRLSPDTAIRDIEHTAIWNMEGNMRLSLSAFSDLQNFAIGAYGNYDQETFERTLEALQRVGEKLITTWANQGASARKIDEKELQDHLCYRLGYMARWTLGHPRAPFVVIERLRDLGIKAAETAQGRLAYRFITALLKVGNDALRERIPDVASYAVGAVGHVASRAVKKQLWEVVITIPPPGPGGPPPPEGPITIEELIKIGRTAARESMDEVVRNVIAVFRNVAITAIDVVSSHPDEKGRAQKVARRFSEAMGRVGYVAIGTVSDKVILRIVDYLAHSKKSSGEPTNIGVKAIQADLGYAVRWVIRSLRGVYRAALRRNRHRVAYSVISAFGTLAEELGNCIKKVGSMDHWVNGCIKTLVNFLCKKVAQDVANNWRDANDEKWLKLGEAVATSLGYATQSAITVDNYDDAKKGVKALEALVQKVEELVGSSGTFPPAWWEEKGIWCRLAVSLGFTSSHAAEKGLEKETLKATSLLLKIGEAAMRAGGRTTVRAVVEAIGRVTEALTKTYGAVSVPAPPVSP